MNKLSLLTITLVTAAIALPFILRMMTSIFAEGMKSTFEEVEKHQTVIVFGAQVYSNGRASAMLYDRIKTGVDLYLTGKVDILLLTGDGREPDYDETAAMRQIALDFGVPDEAIIVDPYGLRTYDSCYRAATVYGVTDAILATQDFHLDRALLTCRVLGLDAVGVAADYQRPTGYSEVSLKYSNIREIPATTVAFYDLLTKKTPESLDSVQLTSLK